MSAFAMEHPFLTFFAFLAVCSTIRVALSGWPKKTDEDV